MWLSHKYTYVPSFSAPRPPTPLGCHRAPGWAPVTKQLLTAICLHMVMSTFQCYSFNSSHPINIFINKYVYIFVSLPTTFLDKLIHVIYTFQSSPRDCRRRERQFNDTQRKHQVVKKKNHWSCWWELGICFTRISHQERGAARNPGRDRKVAGGGSAPREGLCASSHLRASPRASFWL